MLVMIDERPIAYRYELIAPHLTDREHRWAGARCRCGLRRRVSRLV